MTEETPKQTAQVAGRPMFFNRLMTLDRALHANMKFDTSLGYGFAAKSHLIPITVHEFRYVARHYPIVFGGSAVPMPYAVVGLRENTNLLVDDEGRWRPRTYVPATVHTYPFILLPVQQGTDEVSVVIDPDAPSLGDKGEPLFVDGKESPLLQRAVQLTSAYRAGMKRTFEFGKVIADAGLLTPRGIELSLRDGTKARIENFLTLDPEKIDAVANNIFLRWRKENWLLPIFQYLQSIDGWSMLAELESDRLEARNAEA